VSKPTRKSVDFEFQSACQRMLVRLGATQGGRYDMVLPTVAGPMYCTVYDDWLACMFDDVARAKQVVTSGRLNPFSGKWNWHYTKPGPAELVSLYRQLCTVAVVADGAAELQQQYEDSVALASIRPSLSTRLTYMYRDADSYMVSRSVVFTGGSRWATCFRPLLIALGDVDGRVRFVPGQVGLEDLQDGFDGCETRWDPERDHAHHEVTGLEAVIDPVAAEADPAGRSIDEFIEDVCQLAAVRGWDPDYRPPFHAQMRERYAARQCESIP